MNDNERLAYFEALKMESDSLRKAFCLTLFYTGCRISEALNLTVDRVDLLQKHLVFETLKRRQLGVFRAVPIPSSFALMLNEFVAGVDPGTRIWRFSRATAYRMVKFRITGAGVKGGMACPKGLRHGFATACIAKNIPLPTIQKWMGHARLETTAIYLAVSGDEERSLASRLWF